MELTRKNFEFSRLFWKSNFPAQMQNFFFSLALIFPNRQADIILIRLFYLSRLENRDHYQSCLQSKRFNIKWSGTSYQTSFWFSFDSYLSSPHNYYAVIYNHTKMYPFWKVMNFVLCFQLLQNAWLVLYYNYMHGIRVESTLFCSFQMEMQWWSSILQ